MQYPLITEYIEAIQYSESFESADLQALRPVLDANGRPMMTSGNFAVVFKMQNQQTGAEYALKCFTQDQEGRAEAYRQIMAELRYVDSPYFIDLEYIEEAVWAGDFDCAFPAVLMPWVEGEPLDQHIRRLVSEEPDRLQLVAYKFSVMASWLVNQPFAHGDLKPDNILVRQDGSMVLVDYDGIYVPSMRGMTMREAGTPAFRHPNRVNMAFDEYIDDFALATINLSLYLIALKPSLLQTHGAKDRLLFSDDDYRNIAASRIIGEISQLSYDAQLQRLYALFLIALSEGSLQRCENRLMLLAPPQQDFKIDKLVAKLQTAVAQPQPKGDLVFDVKGVQFKMKYVEGGEFMMGATAEQGDDAWDREKPAHKVSLDSYYIGETQVTQALWEAVMGVSIHEQSQKGNFSTYLRGVGDNNPMYYISWDDCQEFIQKLNQLTGRTFALPTEAQWEFAARGGKLSKGYKYAGSNNLGEVAWFDDNSNRQTHPVAQKKPNELGLYDMSGNVWEWCNDWFDSDYYQSSPECNPQGATSGDRRVLRGSCWFDDARYCRVSDRGNLIPDLRDNCIGLRLSLSLQSSDLVFDVNGVQFKMKYVEGGEFMMGATAEQGDDAWDDEKPAHRVSLDSYYIGETQVTQALWKAVMGENPSRRKDDNLPVETISWNNCQEFIQKLNQLTGRTFALPTEAQWEFAARGGNSSRGYKYAGSNDLSEVAWFGDNWGGETHSVAQKKPNELGLYDMSGNVWEWCNDWYDSNYYQSSPECNPQGPTSGDFRVLRGGSWDIGAGGCRVSDRVNCYPGDRLKDVGMRLLLSLQPSDLVFDVNGVQFKMVRVEGGEFMMGATAEQEGDADDREKPAHRVSLDSFYIGETQVTQALWEAVMGNNSSDWKGENLVIYYIGETQVTQALWDAEMGNNSSDWKGENLPIETISWDDCQEFVKRLNKLTGKQFRLPTEAEWEYAVRGGNRSRGYKYAGSNNLSDVAWFGDNSGEQTHPVAQKQSNELGLYDMSGNVWEWCNDWFDSNYYSSSPQHNPQGAMSGYCRVLRGGGLCDDARCCQVSYRNFNFPGERDSYYGGMRLALSVL